MATAADSTAFKVFQGRMNMQDGNYTLVEENSLKADVNSFYLGPPIASGLPESLRNRTAIGVLHYLDNPCNQRNLTEQLLYYTLPSPLVPIAKISSNLPCSIQNQLSSLKTAVNDFHNPSMNVKSVIILRDTSIQLDSFHSLWEPTNTTLDSSSSAWFFYSDEDSEFYTFVTKNTQNMTLPNRNSNSSDIISFEYVSLSGIVPEASTPNNTNISLAITLITVFGLTSLLCFIAYVMRKRLLPSNNLSKTHLPVLRDADLSKITKSTLAGKSQSLLETCTICLECFQIREKVRTLPSCQHLFHKRCIDKWLLKRSTACPNCRLDVRIALGTGKDERDDVVSLSDGSLRDHNVNIFDEMQYYTGISI
ncbi:hypothetical protein HK098_006813 [Nowakowskiella sp. JEL0407]|nr:hypothetical protein HK098_006813 [Nowakowskiella sp. JEL0407]